LRLTGVRGIIGGMKAALLLIPLFLAATLPTGCRVRHIKTTTVLAPDVRNPACSNVVDAALRTLPGREHLRIESIDYATGAITVRYDSMKVGTKNLEAAIAEAGFAAGPFPANPEAAARLPPECRDVADQPVH